MALRVVLVDDDPRFRALARRSLVSEGVDVVAEAGSGAQAVDLIADWEPDVALIDIQMPEVDGVEVARRLMDAGTASIIILISTRDQAYGDRMASGLAAGYLRKDHLSLAAILELAPSIS